MHNWNCSRVSRAHSGSVNNSPLRITALLDGGRNTADSPRRWYLGHDRNISVWNDRLKGKIRKDDGDGTISQRDSAAKAAKEKTVPTWKRMPSWPQAIYMTTWINLVQDTVQKHQRMSQRISQRMSQHETGRATPERPLIKTPVKASQPDLPQIRRKAQIWTNGDSPNWNASGLFHCKSLCVLCMYHYLCRQSEISCSVFPILHQFWNTNHAVAPSQSCWFNASPSQSSTCTVPHVRTYANINIFYSNTAVM